MSDLAEVPTALLPGEHLVPSGDRSLAALLGAATHIAVVAHPDDLELVATPVLAEVIGRSDRSLVGIVCTDGAGGDLDAAVAARRMDEQARAAAIGGYAVVLLGRRSTEVRADPDALAGRLEAMLGVARPQLVVTHDPFDRHATHAAVAAATVGALRRLPTVAGPRVLGCEGWRSLDWLAATDRVGHDIAPVLAVVHQLIDVFTSQLEEKRYDLAVEGRWRSNATFADPRLADATTHLAWSVDLTAACRPSGPTLLALQRSLLERAVADGPDQ